MPPRAEAPAPPSPSQPLDNAFFSGWIRDLTAFFRARLYHSDDAQDRAHDVLLAILELTDWSTVRSPRAYIYRAARYLLYAHWTAGREWRQFLADRQVLNAVLTECNARSGDEPTERLHADTEIERALATLDPTTREVVELWVTGFSHLEIAKELRLSTHKVKRRLALAREQLRPLETTLTKG